MSGPHEHDRSMDFTLARRPRRRAPDPRPHRHADRDALRRQGPARRRASRSTRCSWPAIAATPPTCWRPAGATGTRASTPRPRSCCREVDHLFVAGLSMGALLALKLAIERPRTCAASASTARPFATTAGRFRRSRACRSCCRRLCALGIGRKRAFMETFPYGIKNERIREWIVGRMLVGRQRRRRPARQSVAVAGRVHPPVEPRPAPARSGPGAVPRHPLDRRRHRQPRQRRHRREEGLGAGREDPARRQLSHDLGRPAARRCDRALGRILQAHRRLSRVLGRSRRVERFLKARADIRRRRRSRYSRSARLRVSAIAAS